MPNRARKNNRVRKNKKKEEERCAKEQRPSPSVESARFGTWEWNIETGELVWSRECLEMFGLGPDTEMSYERFLDAVHPEDRQRIDEAVKVALESGGEYSTEMRAVWPDGSIRWVASRARAYFNQAGKPVRMSGAGMDVTDFKEKEESLRRAQAEAKAQAENFSALLDAVPALAFFSQDPACRSMTASHYAHDVFSLPYGKNVSMSAPAGERPNVVYYEHGRALAAEELPMQQAAATGHEFRDQELEVRFPDGRSIHMLGNAVPLFDESGKMRGAVGAFLDVTERKRIEEELRLANERFTISLRNTPITVFHQGLDLRYKWIHNPVGGHAESQIIGKRDSEILERPEDAAIMEEIKREVLRTGNSYEGEVTVQIQGVLRSYHVNIDPQRDPQGRICGLTCASFELTERKRLEAERAKLASQLRLALDAAQMGWWHFDAATQTSTWDDTAKEIFGLTTNSGKADEIVKLVHPDDIQRVWKNFEQAMDPADSKPYAIEYRIVKPDGSQRWVEAHGAGEFEGQGQERRSLGCGGTVRDVTDRKTEQEAFLQQRERSEFVAEGSDVGFWFCDLPFDKLIWDRRVKEHFWLPPDAEVTIGMFYEMLHPDDRERIRKAIEESIATKNRYDVEYRTVAKDGREKWVRAIGRTFYEGGKAKRFDGISMDVTARKKAEDALRTSESRFRDLAQNLDREVQARTAELRARNEQMRHASAGLKELSGRLLQIQDEERRRVARDLHDSAGQIVTALDLELGNIVEQLGRSVPQMAHKMDAAQGLVRELHREIRTTSYLLHPPLLEEAGLYSALSWYVQGVAQRSGMEIQMDVSKDFGRLPRDLELAIFRLVQESFTNIHRHSESKTAAIRMTRGEGAVQIEIRDEGKGIAEERLASILEGGSGVGICGMRERLRQFGGELHIASGKGGTRVFVAIPIAESSGSREGEQLRAAM